VKQVELIKWHFIHDKLLFEYKRIKDTLISVKVRPEKLHSKRNKDDKFSLEIIEEYEGDYHKNVKIYI
jgi:hypothetical protein